MAELQRKKIRKKKENLQHDPFEAICSILEGENIVKL